MSFNVKGHDVDLNITYDFVYMSFIETLVLACTISEILVQILQRSILAFLTLKINFKIHSILDLIEFEDSITNIINNYMMQ